MKYSNRNFYIIKTTEFPKSFRGKDFAYLISNKSYKIKKIYNTNTIILKLNNEINVIKTLYEIERRNFIVDIYNLLEKSDISNLKFINCNEILENGFSEEELKVCVEKLKLIENSEFVAILNLSEILNVCKFYKSLFFIWKENSKKNEFINENFVKYLKKELEIYPEIIRNWILNNFNMDLVNYILKYYQKNQKEFDYVKMMEGFNKQ